MKHTSRFTDTNWIKRISEFQTTYVEIFLLLFEEVHT